MHKTTSLILDDKEDLQVGAVLVEVIVVVRVVVVWGVEVLVTVDVVATPRQLVVHVWYVV